MSSDARVLQEPRWGNEKRDQKGLGIWLTLIRHCGAEISAGTWLDIGCGSGGIAAALAPRVRRIIGIDPQPWSCWATAMAEHDNLSFLVSACDEESMPVAECSMDIVVCNQVYEHVGDARALLRNIHRVLKPEGRCYFAGPNLLWPVEPHVHWPFVHWLRRPFAVRLMKALGSKHADSLDAYSTHYWELTRWFRCIGFSYANGIPARLSAELDGIRGMAALGRVAARVPATAVDLLTPFSPGFVFVVRKQASA